MTWNDITYRQLLDIREAANIEDENERVYAIMEAVFGEDVLNLPLKDFNEKCKEL
jgi:ribosomal protein L12E/L44/L45/RPP1/RPP2